MKHTDEVLSVWRRYTDFSDLYQLLEMEFPACIIPPIPAASLAIKLHGEQCEEFHQRHTALGIFLEKVIIHNDLSSSKIVEDFLKENEFSRKKHD